MLKPIGGVGTALPGRLRMLRRCGQTEHHGKLAHALRLIRLLYDKPNSKQRTLPIRPRPVYALLS
jgi:hypothetical protein